jgi:hypothetical protein
LPVDTAGNHRQGRTCQHVTRGSDTGKVAAGCTQRLVRIIRMLTLLGDHAGDTPLSQPSRYSLELQRPEISVAPGHDPGIGYPLGTDALRILEDRIETRQARRKNL